MLEQIAFFLLKANRYVKAIADTAPIAGQRYDLRKRNKEKGDKNMMRGTPMAFEKRLVVDTHFELIIRTAGIVMRVPVFG